MNAWLIRVKTRQRLAAYLFNAVILLLLSADRLYGQQAQTANCVDKLAQHVFKTFIAFKSARFSNSTEEIRARESAHAGLKNYDVSSCPNEVQREYQDFVIKAGESLAARTARSQNSVFVGHVEMALQSEAKQFARFVNVVINHNPTPSAEFLASTKSFGVTLPPQKQSESPPKVQPRKVLGIKISGSFAHGIPNGAVVINVARSFPADLYIERGDVIVSVEGVEVKTNDSFLKVLKEQTSLKDSLSLGIRRLDEVRHVDVPLSTKTLSDNDFTEKSMHCSVRLILDKATNSVVVVPAAYFGFLIQQGSSTALNFFKAAADTQRVSAFHTLDPRIWAIEGQFDVAVPVAFLSAENEEHLKALLETVEGQYKKQRKINSIISNAKAAGGALSELSASSNAEEGEIDRLVSDEVLVKTRAMRYLGIEMDQYMIFGRPNGIYICCVLPSSPASGLLKAEDRIVSVNGTAVSSVEEWKQAFADASSRHSIVNLGLDRGNVAVPLMTTPFSKEDFKGPHAGRWGTRVVRDGSENLVAVLPMTIAMLKDDSATLPSDLLYMRSYNADGKLSVGHFTTWKNRKMHTPLEVAIPVAFTHEAREKELGAVLATIRDQRDRGLLRGHFVLHNTGGSDRIMAWPLEEGRDIGSTVASHILVRPDNVMARGKMIDSPSSSVLEVTQNSTSKGETETLEGASTKPSALGFLTAIVAVPINTAFLDWGDELLTKVVLLFVGDAKKEECQKSLKAGFQKAFENAYTHFGWLCVVTTVLGTPFSILTIIGYSVLHNCTKVEGFCVMATLEVVEGVISAFGVKSTLGYLPDLQDLTWCTAVGALGMGIVGIVRAKGGKKSTSGSG